MCVCVVPNAHLLILEGCWSQNITAPNAILVNFANMKTTICYSAMYLPLGAATGPAAQSLLSAEFREKNRAFNNTRRGAVTIRPGAQVGVKEK